MPDGEFFTGCRALIGVLVIHLLRPRQALFGGVSVVFLLFNERLDFFQGDVADAGDEVASGPQCRQTGFQFRELLAEDVGCVGFDFADDGADALIWGDLDAEMDVVAHDFRGIELVAKFLLLFIEKLKQAFVHTIDEDLPPIFRAEDDVVLATVADVVDVLVLFWQVDNVHLLTLLFFSYIPKTKNNEKSD